MDRFVSARVRSLCVLAACWPGLICGTEALAQTASPAKDPAIKATHVLGLERVARNASGKITVDSDRIRFVAGTASAEIAVASLEDVFTGDDTRRIVGGFLGTLSMFGPYGSGRFLSLFRKEVDVLTLEYRDASGALHGAVLTMSKGDAVEVKRRLIARGARYSLSVEEEETAEAAAKAKKQEKKP